jgi:hypothetical protein
VLFWFPPIFYITTPEHYYRRPIDPFFVILAVLALVPKAAAKRESQPRGGEVSTVQVGG